MEVITANKELKYELKRSAAEGETTNGFWVIKSSRKR